MKRKIALASLLFIGSTAFPQIKLAVSNLQIEQKEKRVEVSFDAIERIHPFSINNTYTFTPSILKEEKSHLLASIVYGSRRVKILNSRKGILIDKLYSKGDTVRYYFSLPYESWMSDGILVMETNVKGCCGIEMQEPFLLAEHILPTPIVEVVEQKPMELKPIIRVSAGQQLSDKYSFVAPHSDLCGEDGKPVLDFTLPLNRGKAATKGDQIAIDTYLKENDEGALKIYFDQSKTIIDPLLSTNAESLKALLEVVHEINRSPDSRICDIVIAGFASPEGTIAQNEELAWNRAMALQKFILKNTKVTAHQIHLYNGGENWMGLRQLVEQGDMKHRDAVLWTIDHVSMRRGRETLLMDLHRGNPYRYMMEHYFPKLRHAAYIKIYYKEIVTKQE